jgi:hypothetical protein
MAEATKSFTPTFTSEPCATPAPVRSRLLPAWGFWRPTTLRVRLSVAHSVEAHLVSTSGLHAKLGRFKTVTVELFDDLKSRPGRPPVYDHEAIVGVAKEVIQEGVDDHLDWFIERVRNRLKERYIKAPKDTLLTEICEPIYKSAKTEK